MNLAVHLPLPLTQGYPSLEERSGSNAAQTRMDNSSVNHVSCPFYMWCVTETCIEHESNKIGPWSHVGAPWGPVKNILIFQTGFKMARKWSFLGRRENTFCPVTPVRGRIWIFWVTLFHNFRLSIQKCQKNFLTHIWRGVEGRTTPNHCAKGAILK